MTLLRSFFGAFLCATLAVWPAITWDTPWVLFPCGIAGWIIGYHCDRLYRGLRYGIWDLGDKLEFYKQAYVLIFTTIFQSLRKNWDTTVSHVKSSLNMLLYVILAVLGWVFVSVPRFVIQAVTGLVAYERERFSHPMTTVFMIRIALSMITCVILGILGWQLAVMYGPQVGDPVMTVEQAKVLGREYGHYTAADVRASNIATTIGFLLPWLVSIMLFLSKTTSMKRFYTECEQYASNKMGFVLNECVRIIRTCVWVYAIAIAIVGLILFGMVSIAFAVFIGMALFAPVAYIVIVAGHFIYHAARLNRDYGLVSLCTGLVVASTTFFLSDSSVVNETSQLFTALFAGMIAGAISLGLTWSVDQFSGDTRLSYNAPLDWLGVTAEKSANLAQQGLEMLWRLGRKLAPPDMATVS